jgi:hypothetical protein
MRPPLGRAGGASPTELTLVSHGVRQPTTHRFPDRQSSSRSTAPARPRSESAQPPYEFPDTASLPYSTPSGSPPAPARTDTPGIGPDSPGGSNSRLPPESGTASRVPVSAAATSAWCGTQTSPQTPLRSSSCPRHVIMSALCQVRMSC